MALGNRSSRLRPPPAVPTVILDAARDIMRERGIAGLNLNEVARRVGVRTPSLYEYVPGKMALYNELFRLGVRMWAQRVSVVVNADHPSPWDLLIAIFEAYLDFADDTPEMYQLIHERHVPGFEPSPDALAESEAITQLGVDALRVWMDRGEMATGLSAEEAFDLFIVVLHGLIGAHTATAPGDRDPSGRFRRLVPQAVELFKHSWTPAIKEGDVP